MKHGFLYFSSMFIIRPRTWTNTLLEHLPNQFRNTCGQYSSIFIKGAAISAWTKLATRHFFSVRNEGCRSKHIASLHYQRNCRMSISNFWNYDLEPFEDHFSGFFPFARQENIISLHSRWNRSHWQKGSFLVMVLQSWGIRSLPFFVSHLLFSFIFHVS